MQSREEGLGDCAWWAKEAAARLEPYAEDPHVKRAIQLLRDLGGFAQLFEALAHVQLATYSNPQLRNLLDDMPTACLELP